MNWHVESDNFLVFYLCLDRYFCRISIFIETDHTGVEFPCWRLLCQVFESGDDRLKYTVGTRNFQEI